MLNREIDFTFWGVTLFQRALKCITLNKMKKSLVHYGDNVLVFASTKIRFLLRILNVQLGKSHIGVWALSYALHLRCEKFLLVWQGKHIFPLYQKKINCFEEMLYRKNRLYIFGGVTLFERALKCITLNKMKKA